MIEAIRNNCKVDLDHLGEGWDGDFNPDDPDDTPLLRFDVYGRVGSEWLPVVDSSYCTQVSADAPIERKQAVAAEILSAVSDQVNDAIESGEGVDHAPFPGEVYVSGLKRVCEELSWIA